MYVLAAISPVMPLMEEITMLSATLYAKIKTALTRDEDCKLFPYKDTVGKTTIAYGRNLDDTGLYPNEPEFMLSNDINFHHMFYVKHYPWFEFLDENRKAALIDMSYQMGAKNISEFTHMFSALEKKDYLTAGDEAMNSDW